MLKAGWLSGVAIAMLGVGTNLAFAEDSSDWTLSIEGGSELDSNLHRVEVAEGSVAGVDAGALVRSGARYQLGWQPSSKAGLQLDLRGYSKLFTAPEGQSENLGVLYMDGRYRRRIGSSLASVGLRANYYEAFDLRPFGEGVRPVEGRSFRSSEGEASLTLPNGKGHSLTMQMGIRDFVYKPDRDFNWQGEHLGLRYATQFWLGNAEQADASTLDLRAVYRVAVRDYEGVAFRNACSKEEMAAPECFVPTTQSRVDLHHSLVLEASYTGTRIFSLLYGAQFVDSNSHGQASIRQRLEATMTSALVADIFVTAKAVARVNSFLDPLLLARDVQSQTFVSIEDENRNSLSLHLARDFGKQFGVEARLAIYSNEFATETLLFRRQTAYLGVIYDFEKSSKNAASL